jgi:hypothetical protein
MSVAFRGIEPISILVAVLSLSAARPASAQLRPPADAPVVYGHHHLNVSSVPDAQRFFVEGLGGVLSTTTQWFPGTVIKFPNVLVMLNAKAPSEAGKPTTIDRISFQVRDLGSVVQKLRAMSYRAEPSDSVRATNGVDAAQSSDAVSVIGPDAIPIQLVANPKLSDPIALLNVQLASSDPQAMQAWYGKVFGAAPTMYGGARAATLPGFTLVFVQSSAPRAASAGAAIDHIGFEIRNLRDFIAGLGSTGAVASRPYSEFGPEKLGFSFMVDPWGTNIEMNEGLARIFR